VLYTTLKPSELNFKQFQVSDSHFLDYFIIKMET